MAKNDLIEILETSEGCTVSRRVSKQNPCNGEFLKTRYTRNRDGSISVTGYEIGDKPSAQTNDALLSSSYR